MGAALPQFGERASRDAIERVAREAESIGLASLWVQERMLRPVNPRDAYAGGPWPEGYATVFDPIETLTYAAARTERVKLGTSVIDALFHAPVTLGRRFATLDQLSGGRVIAGLGQGWSTDEFEASNVPIKRRGRGFEEFIGAMRAVWGPDPVKFAGSFYRIAESRIGPKPVQPNGPPVIVGAYTPPAIERAAKIADGIMPVVGPWAKLDSLSQTINSFRGRARAIGRDPDAMQVILRINTVIGEEPTKEPRGLFVGSAEQMASDLAKLAEIGVNHVFFDMNFAQVPIDTQLRLLARLV